MYDLSKPDPDCTRDLLYKEKINQSLVWWQRKILEKVGVESEDYIRHVSSMPRNYIKTMMTLQYLFSLMSTRNLSCPNFTHPGEDT